MVVRIAFLLLIAVPLTHQDEPEVAIDGNQEQFIAKGESFTLICRYNASPPVSEVQWIKDGNVITINATVTNGSRVTNIFYSESLSQLSITSASSQDSGDYICNVTNNVTDTTDSTSIVIQEKPSTKLQPKTLTVKEGENVTLFCNSSGSSLTITWKFNGSDVTTSGDSRISFLHDNRHLIITNVSRVNKGEYKCVASNKVGNDTSNTAFVLVEFGPEISEPPTNRTKEEKQTVDFSCVVAGYPTPDVVWTKNGLELNVTGDMRLSVSSNDGDHQLNISNVQQSDAGQYRCVANNSLDTATSSSATLTVQFAPEVTIDGDQKRYLANGTDLLLTCQFNALPTVSEVQWVKDGIVIASTLITPSNGSRVTISHHNESQTQLSIIAVSLEDAGNYTCNVTNNVGSSSSNWTSIVIQVTPSIEQDPKASQVKERENLTLFCNASGSSLRISWAKNGSGINPSEDSRILLSRDNVRLTIVNVSRKDNGAYQCVASNEVGSATSNAAIVNVQFGPEISEPPIDTTKIEGQTVVLNCLVAGYPTPAVAWTKNDVELNSTANLRLSVSSKNGNHTLNITDVQKSDAGKYRCVANNSLQTSKSSPSTLTVQFAPEVTIDGDQIHYVANSTDLQLTCRFNALPPASEVQWLNNGNVIASTLSVPSNGSRATISHHNESQAQLLITTVSLEDAGNYTCNVTNVVGSSSNWTLIIVQVTPAIETHPQADPVKEGENLTFFCNATGSSLTISWTKNGSSINPNEDVRIRLSTDKEHLTIRNVSRKDNGAYRCVASNKVGNATSNAAIVTVRFAPEISQSPRDTTEVEGQTAEFNCVVAGYPKPDVAWEKNGVELNVAKHERLRVSSNDGNHRLIISNVQQSDAGQYKCVANNSLDTVNSSSATLTVHFDPEVTVDGDKEKIVAKGDDIKVTCRHKALPPVTEVQWIKDGEVISTNSTKVINNSRLNILHFNESLIQFSISTAIVADSGNYTCNVTNMVNSSSDSTSIIVEVKPSIITQPKSAAPEEGDTVKLYCNATGSPILHISWTFDGSVIAANENSRISLSNDSQELTITSVKRGDRGDYRCLVKNRVGNDTSDPSVINVLYRPEIITHPKNFTLEEGLSMTLFCNATGNPSPTLSWTKNGSPLNDTQGITFKGDNETLSIASINRSESGNYRCVARNGLGNDLSNPAKVDVQFAPEIVENPKDVTIVEGEDVVFSCTVDGNPSPRVTWTKNEEKLNTTTNLQLTVSSLNNKHNLTITDVHRSDSGQYRCVIINSVGNITSSPGDLNVQFPPEFISSPQNKIVIEEQNVNLTLDCTVYGNPTPDVKWTKDGIDISENQRINVSDFKGNTSSLTITNIVRGDEGQYRCVANNSVNTTTSAPGKLTVNFRADVKISGSEKKYVEINKQIYLMCQYDASPPVSEVQWVKDGSVIARNDGGIGNRLVNITEFTESQSHLLISSSTRDDEGNYTCFVTNAIGNSSDITSVLIQVVPYPPHTLTVDFTGSRVVNISWTAGFDGNSAIQNYTVEISEDNQIFQGVVCQGSLSSGACVVSSTKASLTGLLPWTTYNIRVFATNAIGKSNSSQILTVITDEEVPSEAPTFDVIVVNSTAVNVSWQILSKEKARGAILGYYVFYRIKNTAPWKNKTVDRAGATSLLVGSLNEHTPYEFAMQAFNSKGVSNLSALVEQTTDQHKPSGPPQRVQFSDVTSKSVKVTWGPVPDGDRNGIILGYKVNYRALPSGGNLTEPVSIHGNEQGEGGTKTLESLNEFTNYSISVLAFTKVGNGPPSVAKFVKTLEDKPSAAPKNVSGHNTSSTSIFVTWDDVPAADKNGIITSYNITYHSLTQNHSNSTTVDHPDRQVTLLGLKEFVNYTITVSASTKIGPGPASEPVIVSTDEDKPSAPPVNVKGQNASSTSILVEWGEVPPADQNGVILTYNVSYQSLTQNDVDSKVVGYPANQIKLEGLKKFVNYSITVSASTVKGSGKTSYPIFVITDQDKPTAPPSNVSGHNTSSTSILVRWDNVPAFDQNGIITSYTIKYQSQTEADQGSAVAGPNDREKELKGLKEYVNYNITVLASTWKGDGPDSSPAIVVRTDQDKPTAPPSNVSGHNTSSTSILVQWRKVPSADQNGVILTYTITYQSLTQKDNGSETVDFSKEQTLLTGLKKFVNYNITLFASTVKGNGNRSGPIFVITDQDKPTAAPLKVRGHNTSSTSILVEWDDVPPFDRNGLITSYTITYRSRTENHNGFVKANRSDRRNELTDLREYVNYTITVRASTSKGDGPESNLIDVRTDQDKPSGPPGNLSVINTTSTSIFVMWNEVSPNEQNGIIVSYNVSYRAILENGSAGPFSSELVMALTRHTNLSGLTKDMHYNVSVLASTIKGDGIYSDPRTFRTNEDRPSGPPQRVQGRFTSSTSIMVNWDVVREDQQHGEIISYTVRYKKLTDGTYKEKKVTSRSDELKRLDKYTVYKIEVLASTRIGNGPPSEPIEERTNQDKPEKPPQSVTVTTVDSSSISVTWEPVPKDFQHGIITEYIILYNYSGEGKISEHKVLGNVSQVVVGGLKQSTEYTIRVLAATVKGRGPASSPKSATTEDPPKPREPDEGDVGKTEVNIPFVPKQELSDGAPVTKYQVIVMELTDGQDEGKSSDPKYAKVTRKYEDRVAGEPYVTAEFANNNEKRTSFPVGDGKYYSTEGVTDAKRKRRKVVEKFLNGKLDDGAKYVAFQRSFDKEGDYESEGFVDFETNKDHTVTIVVVVVLIVIITACIAVGIFVYRRRQSSPRNGEEEMALRPQKRGRTLSKRILGRASGAFDNPAHNPGEAVPVEEFEEHVRRLHANGDLLFSQEYGALKPQAEFTWNATLAQENRHKNRYNNVVAYDHSRVKLSHIQGVPGSDYINANFLEGYQKKRAYIASQGPLPETEDDFWRMIWEQDSKIIVMVTNLEERGRIKCHQYWPSEGGKAYGDIQVTLMQIVELSDFTIRTFTLKKANSRSERTLHQYHYTVWPDHGVPSCPTSLLTFVKKASGANPADAGPMVVHCSAGVGRTGTFIVVDAMLQSIAAEKTVDVFGYVMTLRRDRNIMVQVEEQYVFIHEVLLEAIHSGYTEIRANDLRSHMKLLMQVSPSTGQTEMDEEFIRLGRGNTPQTKFQAANMGYNKTKNRYANVLAFDDTRVKLSMITGIEGSDYINANFIDGYMTRRAFIATQAPIPDTIPDFWRMIWEQESSTIVMLSKETESGKVKVHRYWPAKQPANIGTLVVEMTNEMVYEDYTMREIKLTNTKESASRVVRQYHYTGWPDVGSPESGTGLIDLIGQVQRWQQNSGNTTITVHCSAGVGRTGVFCALSILIERLKSEGVVDVFQTVKQLRAQRPAMVQTKDQYEFIYSALSEYLDSFDAYSNFE